MSAHSESVTKDDFDTPWKEVLERYFFEFMAFFFPHAYEEIDLSRGYRFLDKELQQVARDAELGRRYADKLAEMWLKSGDSEWVLAHVEVQGQREKKFPERMFVYNYRIFDKYQHEVVSLAVLADGVGNWRPSEYEYGRWGFRMRMEFPVVKLLDYVPKWDALEADPNPFAVVVMAHLKAVETKDDDERRKYWKLYLCKRLYERGYTREDVIQLFRFIDWLLRLPREAEALFWSEIQAHEEEKKMPYVTSVEKIGIEKGMQQGILKGREEGIQQGRQEGIQQGIQKGIQQGKQEGIRQSIRKLLEKGFSMAEIVRLLDADEETVMQVAKEMPGRK